MLEDFRALAAEKTPRGRPRLAEDSLTQADFARAKARVSSAEAYALSVLADVYERADDWAVINFEDRARVRLICSNAINAIRIRATQNGPGGRTPSIVPVAVRADIRADLPGRTQCLPCCPKVHC